MATEPAGMEDRDPPVVRGCTRCPALVESRTGIVNGQGAPDADLVFVGEAPGRREDATGVPFVGRSGDVLNGALADRGLDRATVRITNSVRCRPPDNRDPHVDERTNCRDHLERELRAVDPSVVMPLGRVPAEELLGRSVRVTDEAGRTETVALGGRERTVVVGLHPAAVLYDRSNRAAFDAALDRAVAEAGLG